MDWDRCLSELEMCRPGVHVIRPPCDEASITAVEAQLGGMPDVLGTMLRRFNGAEMFLDAVPLVTIFGISAPGDSPGKDWFIDRFTPKWRAKMNRSGDWVIGITNYGGVVVLDECAQVREWDTGVGRWSKEECTMEEWFQSVLKEGRDCPNE